MVKGIQVFHFELSPMQGRAELFRRLDRGEDCSNWPSFGSFEGTNLFPTLEAPVSKQTNASTSIN
jgi:hypothetical protein